MKTTLRMVGLLLGCFGLPSGVACTPASPAHRALPVTVPFAMDKAGNTTRIDFSALEGQANLKRRFMVGLDFPQTQNYSIENVIQQKDVPVHVEVFFVDHGKMTPVPTQDDEAIVSAANGAKTKADNSLANLHLHAHDGETSYVLVAGFYLSRYGQYVAVVKTVEDLPMFKNIETRLKVDEFYNTGE
ncbi:MAG TPA: hypothetical protein VGC19_02265 [Rhodanobacter sp.]